MSSHRLCFARARTALLVPARTSVIVAAGIRVTIAQTTVIIAARRLTPQQRMKKGERPFQAAVEEGNIELVQLLAASADINAGVR